MRISDWSSDVCSSDLPRVQPARRTCRAVQAHEPPAQASGVRRMIRSFLFVPGDSEKKLAKADASQADALILDLEDAVAPARKDHARTMVPDFLAQHPRDKRPWQLWAIGRASCRERVCQYV